MMPQEAYRVTGIMLAKNSERGMSIEIVPRTYGEKQRGREKQDSFILHGLEESV